METVLRIKVSDLDADFIKAIKTLFKKDREIEITVSSASDFGLNQTETKEEYIARILKAANNVERGNVVSLTEDEFEKVTEQFIGQK
jgi:hypothetical protein